MKKILIWGTGVIAKEYLKTGEIRDEELCGFVETQKSKEQFNGKKVFAPSEVAELSFDYILVLVAEYTREIQSVAAKSGIELDKLVFYDTVEWYDGKPIRREDKMRLSVKAEPCAQDEAVVEKLFPKLYEMIREKRFYARSIISTYRNGKDDIADDVLVMGDGFDSRIYSDDYFRYRTFEFAADEIEKNHVEGACAEVGVFRGYFSRLINAKLHNKSLYLFDTFEGFDQQEIKKEMENGNAPSNVEDAFRNTSVELVLDSMPYKDRCIVRKGYFPGTAVGLEDEKYAFVSIDVDLEDSILEGLRYFYPRVSEGGYIFVHDYNNRMYFGVKCALKRYEDELSFAIKKLPIADQGGTIVIVK